MVPSENKFWLFHDCAGPKIVKYMIICHLFQLVIYQMPIMCQALFYS